MLHVPEAICVYVLCGHFCNANQFTLLITQRKCCNAFYDNQRVKFKGKGGKSKEPAKKSNKQSKDDKAGGKKKAVKAKVSIINF